MKKLAVAICGAALAFASVAGEKCTCPEGECKCPADKKECAAECAEAPKPPRPPAGKEAGRRPQGQRPVLIAIDANTTDAQIEEYKKSVLARIDETVAKQRADKDAAPARIALFAGPARPMGPGRGGEMRRPGRGPHEGGPRGRGRRGRRGGDAPEQTPPAPPAE